MHLTRDNPRTVLAGRGECAVLHAAMDVRPARIAPDRDF